MVPGWKKGHNMVSAIEGFKYERVNSQSHPSPALGLQVGGSFQTMLGIGVGWFLIGALLILLVDCVQFQMGKNNLSLAF